ncbi:MAG: sugar phosphate isomerase/epimerase [Candidatus Omnitrophica bacterium]|nr:sugar phosphate isomerase/epimerase [Candidatus Omnitrophota bacterium]MBU4478116.1 sugar phosphate isomerase/epimerase [Candidatus Omnitrophota bacterium]MCG2704035.1 sugar phosphate isomerase/epimerase [Candidatus Omnitrophota bacterium]
MLSVSTTWNALCYDNGGMILTEIKSLGIDTVELGSSLTKRQVEDIVQFKKNGFCSISSVHNYCPVPDGFESRIFTPDFFSLSSPDEAQRCKAVDLTVNTMRIARESGAQAVIIHAGRVEMEQRTKKLIELYKQGCSETPAYLNLLSEMKKERENKKAPYVAAILRSLEALIPQAAQMDIKLCLENRFYYREIPSFNEIGLLLNYFKGEDNLCYWHDVGHAQVGENLGFYCHLDFLKHYAEKMAGIHLHDVSGAKDHKVPGEGRFDFRSLKPYLKTNTIMVVEVHQPATVEALKAGIGYLKSALGI